MLTNPLGRLTFNQQQTMQFTHFTLECLSDGVYAAIQNEGAAAISNAGIVDLGDRMLVCDSTFTPQAGAELRRAAEQLTGRPIFMLFNTHFHNDHIWGNQSFAVQTDVVASEKTRRLIITEGPQELAWLRDGAEGI